jgi:SpoVA protein.
MSKTPKNKDSNGRYKNKENNELNDSVINRGKEFRHINKDNYSEYVSAVSPGTSHWKNIIWAFLIGGTICTIGQAIIEIFILFDYEKEDASGFASCILVILAALATGIGIYDRLGRFAGAGSTIPITGFFKRCSCARS